MIVKALHVAELSGSIQGVTARRMGQRLELRAKSTQRAKTGTRAVIARARFVLLQRRWRTLSAADQMTWRQYAEPGEGGAGYHLRLNTMRSLCGLSLLTAPQAINKATGMLPSFSILITLAADEFRFLLPGSSGANWFWMMSAGPPEGPGQRAPQHRAPVFMAAQQGFASVNIFTQWTSTFGTLQSGQRIRCKLLNVDVIHGRILGPIETLAVVP